MSDYTQNKAPKDTQFCKILKRSINLDRKRQEFSWDDAANELGLNGGTLENKLKPAMPTSDITISEFIHFMELSADYDALEYLAKKFDLALIPKSQAEAKACDVNTLVDIASIENSDVFRVVKTAMADGVITEEEKAAILKEIDEAEKANALLKDKVLHLASSELKKD